MIRNYFKSRTIPPIICSTIAAAANIQADTAILDIGTGPGFVALGLARWSEEVTGIDLSQPFLEQARSSAKARDLQVRFVEMCGNRLVFSDLKFDIVTISQAFHWLDAPMAARGIYRVLRSRGAFYSIDPMAMLPDHHPLNSLLGYGRADQGAIELACNQQLELYAGLFRSVRPSDSVLQLRRVWLFHERRLFDAAYARTFFFTRKLRVIWPHESDPWTRLEQTLHHAGSENLFGDMYWLLSEFVNDAHPITHLSSPIVTLGRAVPIVQSGN
jgi:ubiquinone/menaquinone biosynthesis C-methylase UbiE